MTTTMIKDIANIKFYMNAFILFEVNYTSTIYNYDCKLPEAYFHCKDTDYYYFFNGKEYVHILGNSWSEVIEIVRKETTV